MFFTISLWSFIYPELLGVTTLVVKHNGGKPNLKSTLIRTLVRFIPVEIFFFTAIQEAGMIHYP
jgi:hypothetical protein